MFLGVSIRAPYPYRPEGWSFSDEIGGFRRTGARLHYNGSSPRAIRIGGPARRPRNRSWPDTARWRTDNRFSFTSNYL